MLAIESGLGRVAAATIARGRGSRVDGVLGQGALVLSEWLLDLGIHDVVIGCLLACLLEGARLGEERAWVTRTSEAVVGGWNVWKG